MEATDNAERKVRVELSIKLCEEAMFKSFGKHELPYSLAVEITDSEALKSDLENWLDDVTKENDEFLKTTRECIHTAFLKRKKFLSVPIKPSGKPSLLLRFPKHPPPIFIRHLASDSRKLSLQNTDSRRSVDKMDV